MAPFAIRKIGPAECPAVVVARGAAVRSGGSLVHQRDGGADLPAASRSGPDGVARRAVHAFCVIGVAEIHLVGSRVLRRADRHAGLMARRTGTYFAAVGGGCLRAVTLKARRVSIGPGRDRKRHPGRGRPMAIAAICFPQMFCVIEDGVEAPQRREIFQARLSVTDRANGVLIVGELLHVA